MSFLPMASKNIPEPAALRVGVLALQGDFEAHRRRLTELGAEAVLVRTPSQLDSLDALIIPGGESTTFLWHLAQGGFLDAVRRFLAAKPGFGTCAGAILLAKEVENPPQKALGVLDISIVRNAYGRQLNSFIGEAEWAAGGQLEAVFIRAPKISRVGPGVEVLASESGNPVLVRQGRIMAATFHPELSQDVRVHKLFLDFVGQARPSARQSEIES